MSYKLIIINNNFKYKITKQNIIITRKKFINYKYTVVEFYIKNNIVDIIKKKKKHLFRNKLIYQNKTIVLIPIDK